jgi:hypothetical protein
LETLLERHMETLLEFAMPLVEAQLKTYQVRFGHSLNNILMATALHTH